MVNGRWNQAPIHHSPFTAPGSPCTRLPRTRPFVKLPFRRSPYGHLHPPGSSLCRTKVLKRRGARSRPRAVPARGRLLLASPPPLAWRAAHVKNNLLVIKLGGDAVATPEQIAAASRRVAMEASRRAVIVVTSARRGMTDHLIRLCRDVDHAATGTRHGDLLVAADRAVASGEVVTAALVATALLRLGVDAVSLDAREAGLRGGGPAGQARLRRVRRIPLHLALRRGRVPVVTGFQVAHRGTIRTLGRGGSDVTAVALAAAFGAEACRFYKLHGLRLGDPSIDSSAGHAGSIGYPQLHRLLEAGAKVLHPDAAVAAERYKVRLEFEEFPGTGVTSVVSPSNDPDAAPTVAWVPR